MHELLAPAFAGTRERWSLHITNGFQSADAFLDIFITAAPTNTSSSIPTWSDFNPEHPAADAAIQLFQQGVLTGLSDGTVLLDTKISRIETLVLVTRALGFSSLDGGDLPFPDTPASSWYAGTLRRAVEKGIVHGYGDSTFRPENTITLPEALKILTISFGFASFSDQKNYAIWYIPYVDTAQKIGLVLPSEEINDTALSRGDFIMLLAKIVGMKK